MNHKENFKSSVRFALILLIAMVFVHFIELVIAIKQHTAPPSFGMSMLKSFVFQFPTALLGGFIMLLSAYLKKRPGEYLMYFYATLLFLINFGLCSYSLQSNSLLGADFWAYTMDELYDTAMSSASIPKSYFLMLIVPFVILKLGLRFIPSFSLKYSGIVGLAILATSIFSFTNIMVLETSEQLATNKTLYFITNSFKNDAGKDLKQKDLKFASRLQAVEDFQKLNAHLPISTDSLKPNIIILIVEGLGNDMLGNGKFGGFMPFLDQLSTKSLYWPNALSTTGRTFGVLPAVLASLPYPDKGFLNLGPYYPEHISLPQILKRNNYRSQFFHGGDLGFENQEMFLKYQGFDKIFQKSDFPESSELINANKEGFTWGYHDHELLQQHLNQDTYQDQPQLDILLTMSMHQPFDIPKSRINKVNRELKEEGLQAKQRSLLKNHTDIMQCLYYVDSSIKNWFEALDKSGRLENTIVVITGDHRVVPLPIGDNFERFNVPIIMYSNTVKPTTFKSIQTHSDIFPSLLGTLKSHYNINCPDSIFAMNKGLDTTLNFSANTNQGLMSHKGSLDQFISGTYYLSRDLLYRVNKNLGFTRVKESSIRDSIVNLKNIFEKEMQVLVSNNAIRPSKEWRLDKYLTLFEFTSEEGILLIDMGCRNMGADSLFFFARDLAFNKEYAKSRLAAKYLLNNSPGYTDAQILMGRTYTWQGEYKMAEEILRTAIATSPRYYDGYSALADTYRWSDQNKKAMDVVNEGLLNIPNNKELLQKKEQLTQ